jgi:hypothetical protein
VPSFEALFAALSPCIGNMLYLLMLRKLLCFLLRKCAASSTYTYYYYTQSTTGTEYRQPDRVPDQSVIWFFLQLFSATWLRYTCPHLIILNATTAKAKPVLLVRDTQSPRAKASNLIVLLCHYLTPPLGSKNGERMLLSWLDLLLLESILPRIDS